MADTTTTTDPKSRRKRGSSILDSIRKIIEDEDGGVRRRRSSLVGAIESVFHLKDRPPQASPRDGDTAPYAPTTVSNESMTKTNIWSKMSRRESLWDDMSDDSETQEINRCEVLSMFVARKCHSIGKFLKFAFTTPKIASLVLLTFTILLIAGLATVLTFAKQYEDDLVMAATNNAEDIGYWVSRELDKGLLPLFTMAQFVQQLDTFKSMPFAIADAPPLTGKEGTHRNVTGICDDPDILERYNEIAEKVKENSGMGNVLVNIQLAPHSVVCLFYPLVNSEDFEDGIVLNNTGAVGHDLLNDPNRVAIARATVPSPGVVIAGPLTLIQGDNPVVKEAFIARLAINMEGHSIFVDDVEYPCWGFAVIILNWEAMKNKIGLNEMFDKLGMEFLLTRTDTKVNETTNEEYYKVATIAQSAKSHVLTEENSVTVPLDTTNNVWEMTVGYEDGLTPSWKGGACFAVFIGALVVSIMLMMVLVTKHEQQLLLYRMMPPKIIKKLQKGKTVIEKHNLATIYFSDIVGFTTLSGGMRPIQVMKMLNDLYTEFDKIVAKHKLYKVETIGDAYIVIGGGPDNCMGIEGAEKIALFALEAINFCKNYKTDAGASVHIRAGLASGPVVAGVVGTTLPKYTLFGDTVNLASRMESTGTKMRCQCSDMTYRLLKDAPNYIFNAEPRIENGKRGVFVKGKGDLETWWINEAKSTSRADDRVDINFSKVSQDPQECVIENVPEPNIEIPMPNTTNNVDEEQPTSEETIPEVEKHSSSEDDKNAHEQEFIEQQVPQNELGGSENDEFHINGN